MDLKFRGLEEKSKFVAWSLLVSRYGLVVRDGVLSNPVCACDIFSLGIYRIDSSSNCHLKLRMVISNNLKMDIYDQQYKSMYGDSKAWCSTLMTFSTDPRKDIEKRYLLMFCPSSRQELSRKGSMLCRTMLVLPVAGCDAHLANSLRMTECQLGQPLQYLIVWYLF